MQWHGSPRTVIFSRVSLFKPGESASAFIERADKALYRAKRLGRDRIELDLTYETEEGEMGRRRRSTDV